MLKIIILISLLVLQISCSTPQPLVQTKIIEVPVRQVVKVPSELTELCKVKTHERSERYTYGDVITYLVEALSTISDCNKKLGSISELNNSE